MKNAVGTFVERIKSVKGIKRVEYISTFLLIVFSLILSVSIAFSLAVPAMISAFISFLLIIILIFVWLWGD